MYISFTTSLIVHGYIIIYTICLEIPQAPLAQPPTPLVPKPEATEEALRRQL